MVCIYCGSETHVVNSRLQRRANQVWRRRKCSKCGAVFTTTESAAYDAAWRVRSPAGGLAPFNRYKLFISLHKSLAHRTSALEDASALVDTIMAKLRGQAQNGVIEAKDIVKTAQNVLNHFDKPAATSYQAFHPIKQ